MFDEAFFKTSLPEHIKAKETESGDQPSVHVTLRSGQAYKIGRILEVSPQWVMFDVYPPDGKPPRQYSAQAQHAGAPLHHFDRLAVAYEYIVLVMVTLDRNRTTWDFAPFEIVPPSLPYTACPKPSPCGNSSCPPLPQPAVPVQAARRRARSGRWRGVLPRGRRHKAV